MAMNERCWYPIGNRWKFSDVFHHNSIFPKYIYRYKLRPNLDIRKNSAFNMGISMYGTTFKKKGFQNHNKNIGLYHHNWSFFLLHVLHTLTG